MSFVLISASIVSTTVKAYDNVDTSSPYKLVETLGVKVFEAVGSAKANGQITEQHMQNLIEELMMPHIDVPFASYKILGPQLKKISKDERKAFVNAMKNDLLKTYSSALAQYDNQTVKFEPAKEVKQKKTVAVKADLIAQNGQVINMIFKLRKNKKTNQWKAYDLVVEGISLVASKRAELSKPLRSNGVEYVINLLDTKS